MEEQKLVEKYKDILDTEFVPLECVPSDLLGKYEINKLGQIKTVKTGFVRENYCMDGSGYPRVSLIGNHNYTYPVHVLLAKTFILNLENKPIVDHIDRNRSNFSLNNLRFLTHSENSLNRNKSNGIIFFIKLDLEGKEIDRFDIKDLSISKRNAIYVSIKKGRKYKGYFWKSINIEIEDYINRFGYPEELNWKTCLRIPELECNINGMLRGRDGKLTIGSKANGGYRRININGAHYYIHRLVYETFSGELLNIKDIVDHISTVKDDNRYCNLKKCSQSENMLNPITVEKRSKVISLYNLDGSFICDFKSIKEAASYFNLSYNTISASIRQTTILIEKLWCYKGEEYNIELKLKRMIFKYNERKELERSFLFIKYAANESITIYTIKKYIDTGKLAPDGYYYYHGPYKFTDDEQNKNQDPDNNI